MARRPTGTILERSGKRGISYAARFMACGERQYETLGHSWNGYSRQDADEALANILADVRRGIWQPWQPPVVALVSTDPSFHELASQWFAEREPEVAVRTAEDYRWALTNHLLPFFAKHRVSQISIPEVDAYRVAKVGERLDPTVIRPLSNDSINKTIKRLAQVLDMAVEYGYLSANPARGRRRRLKPDHPRRARMQAEQVAVLLQAAGQHRALLATAIMAGGVRVSELTALRWRDVSLADHRLSVADSKTPTGVRESQLSPDLRDQLASHRELSAFNGPDDFVFPTRRGTRRDRNTVRTRILYPAIARANARLAQMGRPVISPDVTFHSLRHTYASLLVEEGADPGYLKVGTML
jgi:integrase